MTTPQTDHPWQRLLDAGARPVNTKPNTAAEPPPGLLDALRHQRAGLWRIARTLIWRKCSLLLAAAAVLVYLVAIIHFKSPESNAPAIPRPETPPLLQP